MGLLGRSFKTSKFTTLAKVAVSRIAILKNQHKARLSYARSDVVELLRLGHQDRALLRVDQVIKEQNMLDAYIMIENYCLLLIEMVRLLQKTKECPDELKEAISSLIFASSRCGEFPELQHIREMFESRFGKDFAVRAVELRNDCRVNPKIIQKLSTRRPNLETRSKVLKEIASENGITLNLEENAPVVIEEKYSVNQKQKHPETKNDSVSLNKVDRNEVHDFPEKLNLNELAESIKAIKKYKDAAAAAQEAFESAAYAAAAARIAAELSRSESQDDDSDEHDSSISKIRTIRASNESLTSKLNRDEYIASEKAKLSSDKLRFDKVRPVNNFSSESESQDIMENGGKAHLKGMEDSKRVEMERTDEDSGRNILDKRNLSSDIQNQGEVPLMKHLDIGSGKKPSLPTNGDQHVRSNEASDQQSHSDENRNKLSYQSPNWITLKSQADPMMKPLEGKSQLTSKHNLNMVGHSHSQHSNIDRQWVSVRTRRAPRV